MDSWYVKVAYLWGDEIGSIIKTAKEEKQVKKEGKDHVIRRMSKKYIIWDYVCLNWKGKLISGNFVIIYIAYSK